MENGAEIDAARSRAGSVVAPAARQIPPAERRGRGPVCVVEDDEMVNASLTDLLEILGFAVMSYSSGAQFLSDARRTKAKCVIIDQHMPGMTGLDVLAGLCRERDALPAILITAQLDPAIAARARELGVCGILEKPFRVAPLVDLVRGALDLSGRAGNNGSPPPHGSSAASQVVQREAR